MKFPRRNKEIGSVLKYLHALCHGEEAESPDVESKKSRITGAL